MVLAGWLGAFSPMYGRNPRLDVVTFKWNIGEFVSERSDYNLTSTIFGGR